MPLDTPNLSERDQAYLTAMTQALLFGIVAASVIAIALGFVFGNTLSHTLRRLAAALQAVALQVRARDEES